MNLVWIKPVCKWFLFFLSTVEANIIVSLQHRYVDNIDTSQTWTDIRVSREKRKIIKDLNEQRLTIF